MSQLSETRSAILRIAAETTAGRLTALPDAGWWARYPLLGPAQWLDVYTRGANLSQANQFLLGWSFGMSLADVLSMAPQPTGVWDEGVEPATSVLVAWDVEIMIEGKDPRIQTLRARVSGSTTLDEIEEIMRKMEQEIANSPGVRVVFRAGSVRLQY